MDNTPTGSIFINLVDGTRQALPSSVKWLATMHDGRSPSEWKMIKVKGTGSAELIKGLTFLALSSISVESELWGGPGHGTP